MVYYNALKHWYAFMNDHCSPMGIFWLVESPSPWWPPGLLIGCQHLTQKNTLSLHVMGRLNNCQNILMSHGVCLWESVCVSVWVCVCVCVEVRVWVCGGVYVRVGVCKHACVCVPTWYLDQACLLRCECSGLFLHTAAQLCNYTHWADN